MKKLLLAGLVIAPLAAGAALAEPSVAPETNPVLTLVRQAQEERVAKENDQFAATPSHADMIGSPFTISINGDSKNFLSFLDYYHDGVLSMNLTKTEFYYNKGATDIDAETQHVPAIQIASREKSSRQYEAQNAYGAKAQVTSSVNEVGYIAAFVLPRGDRPETLRDVAMPDDPDLDAYEWKETLDGPAAKAIYQGSKLVIEGTIASFPDGKVTHCDTTAATATIDEPTEVLDYDCYVAAKVSRIAFVSGDGSVLREWKIR